MTEAEKMTYEALPMKLYAVLQVVHNWRIRTRLPRITKLAVKMGLI